MSQASFDPKLSFLLGWLFGRRRRHSGVSIFLLLMGVLACLSGCPMAVFGVPYSWRRSEEVKSLPRPEPAELRALSPGTSVLIAAQLPPDTPVGPYGLALFYTEYRQQGTSESNKDETPSGSSSSWQIEQPPPQRIEMSLEDGTPLSVQIPFKTSFLKAQRFEEEGLESSGTERRHVGYLPGQTLTIEGTWEGNDLLTARTLYAGTPDDYQGYLASQPGTVLLMGTVCGGLGMGLLVIWGVLRLLGR